MRAYSHLNRHVDYVNFGYVIKYNHEQPEKEVLKKAKKIRL